MNAQQIRAYRKQARKDGWCGTCCRLAPREGLATCDACIEASAKRVQRLRKAQVKA